MTDLLDKGGVAELLGTCKRTIIRYRDQGILPPAVKLGPRLVRWRRSDIEAWVEGGCIPWHRTQAPRRGRARA